MVWNAVSATNCHMHKVMMINQCNKVKKWMNELPLRHVLCVENMKRHSANLFQLGMLPSIEQKLKHLHSVLWKFSF